jgi:hypothetical protein
MGVRNVHRSAQAAEGAVTILTQDMAENSHINLPSVMLRAMGGDTRLKILSEYCSESDQ